MLSFRERASEQLSEIDRLGLRRRARGVEWQQGPRLRVDNRPAIGLCSNDSLGLAEHPGLLVGARAALSDEGIGAGLREADALRTRLHRHALRLREGLRQLGYGVPAGDGPIIPVRVGEPGPTIALSQALFERGAFVHGVRPPPVPSGTGRLRVVPMATHTDDDIDEALEAFAEVRR